MTKTRFSFWLDIAIGVLFAATIVSIVGGGRNAQAGDRVHAVLGILLAIGCVTHQALHWNWIKTVILAPSGNRPPVVRRNRRVAFWLFGLFFVCVITGFVPLALMDGHANPLEPSAHAWAMVHSITGVALLGLTGYHVALHWKWIATNRRRSTRVGR